MERYMKTIQDWAVIAGIILAIGGVFIAYDKQTFASATEVEVIKQKQTDEYQEIIKRLDSIDQHLGRIENSQ